MPHPAAVSREKRPRHLVVCATLLLLALVSEVSGACGNEIMQTMCRHAAARSGTIGKRVAQLACACSKCACTATRRAQRAKGRDAPAALPVSSVLRDVSRTGVHGRGRANCATLLYVLACLAMVLMSGGECAHQALIP